MSSIISPYEGVQKWSESGADYIGTDGMTSRGSGDVAIDTLLNGMLKSDANTRLSAAQVRDDPLMKTPGVGSPEVRELIKALAGSDIKEVDKAREKVREKFGNI